MSEIKLEFDADPYNWRILRGKDHNRYLHTFIAHDDKKLWQIKSEWKNPLTSIGIGCCVKRNLNDEISDLMSTGTSQPIHEIYPNDKEKNLIIAFGMGKYSPDSITQITDLLHQDIPGYSKKIENEINFEFQKLLYKEQLLNHYL
jgi:hypothetical protein